MLFVDDDEPEPFKRSEHGRAGADDDVDVAAPDPLPLVVPLAGREPAVLNRHAIAKVLAAHRSDRRRQCDFRDEDERATGLPAGPCRQAQVDLGLSAAGHAVEERDAECAGVRQPAQPFIRRHLLERQCSRGGPGLRRCPRPGSAMVTLRRRERVALQTIVADRHVPVADET